MQPLLSTLMITTDNPCICISESWQYQCLLHKIRIIYYLLPIADILLGHSLSPGVGQLQGVAPPCQVCPWRRSASPPFHLPHTPRYGHRAHLWRTATWKKQNISNFSSFIVILTRSHRLFQVFKINMHCHQISISTSNKSFHFGFLNNTRLSVNFKIYYYL